MSSPRRTTGRRVPVLDHDYEIRPCQPEPHEDPARNKAEAEREAADGIAVGVVRRQSVRANDGRGGQPTALRHMGPVHRDDIRGGKSVSHGVADASDACSDSQSDAGLAPLQSPDRAGHLEHLAGRDRTGSCTKAIS